MSRSHCGPCLQRSSPVWLRSHTIPLRLLPPQLCLHPSRHGRAPLVEALGHYRAAGTVAFSTPGHKGGAAANDDLREVLGAAVFASDIWLNTGDHDAVQREAEDLAADAWGAERSFFLTNGSSAGNHAALLAMLGPGDEVVVARDLHTSLLTALIHTGARPIYVAPQLHGSLDISLGVCAEDVAAVLSAHPTARLVVLTSPSYWGVASDVAGIAAVAHAHGVPLYVDEAWGPHLPFHPDLPLSAMASGADVAVTSAHKLLSSLSQGAILNAGGARLDLGRLSTAVRMGQTTSPLVPILASLDACRRQMVLDGEWMLERALELAAYARQRLGSIPGIAVRDAERLGLPPSRFDATRLVIDVQGLGITGFAVERALRDRFGVAVEMSDLIGIVCLVTIGDSRTGVDRLVTALATIAGEQDVAPVVSLAISRSAGAVTAPGEQIFSPREAFFTRARAVPLAEAAGEVAAELVVPYPPGIPVLVPGECISEAKIDYLTEVAGQAQAYAGPPTLGWRQSGWSH